MRFTFSFFYYAFEFGIVWSLHVQRTSDPDALELYAKKVRTLDKRSGNVTFNFSLVGVGILISGDEW